MTWWKLKLSVSSKATPDIRCHCWMLRSSEEPKNLITNDSLQGDEGGTGTSASAPQVKPSKSTLSSFQEVSSILAQNFLWGATPSSFLIWEGIDHGRGKEMGGSSRDLLCARISVPVQSGGGFCHFWAMNGKGAGATLSFHTGVSQVWHSSNVGKCRAAEFLAGFQNLQPPPRCVPPPHLSCLGSCYN